MPVIIWLCVLSTEIMTIVFPIISASFSSSAETTPSEYFSSASTPVASCCICRDNETPAVTSIDDIKEQLLIDKTTLSSFKRSKTSAEDIRISSRYIGLAGSVVIASVLGLIVSLDAFKFLKRCRWLRNKIFCFFYLVFFFSNPLGFSRLVWLIQMQILIMVDHIVFHWHTLEFFLWQPMVPIADLQHFSGVEYQGITVFARRGRGFQCLFFLVNYYVKYPASQDPHLSLNANY